MGAETDYDEVKDELKFLSTSGVRVKILISLNNGNLATDQLKDKFGYRTSTILPVLAELKSKNLIEQYNRDYGLTSLGKFYSLLLINNIEMLKMLMDHETFWLNHEVQKIPEPFLSRIGSLNNSQIMDDTSANPFETHEKFVGMLDDCRVVRGVSPILYPDYPDLFKRLIGSKADVRLLVTIGVFELMRVKYDGVLQDVINEPNFSLRTTREEIRTAFTVTDKFLSLGLYRTDGKYDFGTDLVSEDAAAIEWGNALFEYYWKQSTDVTLQDCD